QLGPVKNAISGGSWVPAQPEWSNLVIQRQPADITASSSSATRALAADGNPDITDSTSAWRSNNEANPYWEVDLAQSTRLSAVSIYPQALTGCGTGCASSPAYPRDLKVFVFDDPNYRSIKDPAVLATMPHVASYFWSGSVGPRLNIQTRYANQVPGDHDQG